MTFWTYLDVHPMGGGLLIGVVCLTAIVCCAAIAAGLERKSEK